MPTENVKRHFYIMLAKWLIMASLSKLICIHIKVITVPEFYIEETIYDEWASYIVVVVCNCGRL